MSFKHTGSVRYLAAAQKVAEYFIRHIPADGRIPVDFCQPAELFYQDDIAAAVAACGLIELARLVPERAEEYIAPALKLLHTLDVSADWSPDTDGLLRNCGADYHGPLHNVNYTYGDYFFIEAILKLTGRGVGTYVIDAGWYDDAATESASRLGSWQVSRKAFPHGLCPVVDAIHDAGMKAGIWFEFEVAGRDDAVCFQKLDWLLHRDGRPITAGDRRFWDMRKPEVQEYLAEKVIAFLRDNRFDYMKVDYNETIGIGCDGAESLGEGLRQQIGATQAFFARIQRELPELVIELCSSGGHRLVHSFLNLCPMASFSDAHECDEIPIIAANMHRILLPRQSRIWAVVHPEHTLQKLYYQICSGLLGRLCYSGDIFALREEQWQVMQAGCDFYARAAPVIAEGFSKRYGPKIASYRYPRGWQAVVRRGKNQTLTVLHTFHEAPDRVELPDIGSNPQLFARSGIALDGKTVCGLTDFDGVAILTENED